MSNIDKQALREAATKAKELGNISRYTKAMIALLEFKEAATPDAVLSLLDELEAAEKRIAELELLTAPQLPHPALVVPDEMPEPDTARMFFTDAVVEIAKVQGWNACRAAILQRSEPVTDNTNQQFESLSRGDK